MEVMVEITYAVGTRIWRLMVINFSLLPQPNHPPSLLSLFSKGTSQKRVFERITEGDDLSFLAEQEAYIFYIYMKRYLMSLFELGYQYIIFVTFEVEFMKILDRGNKMSILSSHRNEFWIIPTNLNQYNLLLIVEELLRGSSRSLMLDCESVELRIESGKDVQWSAIYTASLHPLSARSTPLVRPAPCTQLYKRPCPSIDPLIHWSVETN